MTLKILDPLAEINKAPEGRQLRSLEKLEGKRIGLLWSQHASSVNFWPVFEKVVEAKWKPSEVQKLYKHSSWNTASTEELAEFADNVDFVVVGVGG